MTNTYNEIINALCWYYGDGELRASEMSAREALCQEDDQIQTIADALDDYHAS